MPKPLIYLENPQKTKQMKQTIFFILILFNVTIQAQIKVLFDATKAETANNADWIIDADNFNLRYHPNPVIGGSEANPQRFPTPDQSTVTASTTEDYWTGANSAWGIELVQYGYQVETLPYDGQITYNDTSNPQDLSQYDVFIVTEPNILFTPSEQTAILNFVNNGGGLFITSDHDRSDRNGDGVDSVDVWNDLFQNNPVQTDPFGFLFNYENFNETTYNVANLSGNPILHGFFGDVTALEFHGGTSIDLFPGDNHTVAGLIFKQGTQETMFASAEYGQGRVVAIGDSSPADDGTGDTHDNLYDGWYAEGAGSHRKLMLNATIWLAQEDTGNVIYSSENPFKVWINNHILHIKNLGNHFTKIQIISLSGQSVLTQNYADDIDISQLKQGLYFIQLQDNSGRFYTQKIVL